MTTAASAVEVAPPRRTGKLELFLLVLRQQPLFAFGYVLCSRSSSWRSRARRRPVDPEEANASASLLARRAGTH